LNLVIDQGNSLTKTGVFDQSRLIHSHSLKNTDENSFLNLMNEYHIDQLMVSSVTRDGQGLFEMLQKHVAKSHFFDMHTTLPFTSLYQTPETIGKDRLAAVAGAMQQYPMTDVLVIDAGTAITYELLTRHSVYQGGNIAPGLQMRFRALNQFTSRLPLCEPDDTFALLGNSTQTAITAGVQNGLIFEIDGYIDTLKKQYPDLHCIITGGDADFFAGKLKNPIFVDQNLVLKGLNRILEQNV
jgi:type III pantothenate kinase